MIYLEEFKCKTNSIDKKEIKDKLLKFVETIEEAIRKA